MSRESEMVVIRRDNNGSPTVWCDPEIVDIVAALNDSGLKTAASCSGHGERLGSISLADGRQLIICDNLEAHNNVFKAVAGRQR